MRTVALKFESLPVEAIITFSKLYKQFSEANQLKAANKNNLEVLGYGKQITAF